MPVWRKKEGEYFTACVKILGQRKPERSRNELVELVGALSQSGRTLQVRSAEEIQARITQLQREWWAVERRLEAAQIGPYQEVWKQQALLGQVIGLEGRMRELIWALGQSRKGREGNE